MVRAPLHTNWLKDLIFDMTKLKIYLFFIYFIRYTFIIRIFMELKCVIFIDNTIFCLFLL